MWKSLFLACMFAGGVAFAHCGSCGSGDHDHKDKVKCEKGCEDCKKKDCDKKDCKECKLKKKKDSDKSES